MTRTLPQADSASSAVVHWCRVLILVSNLVVLSGCNKDQVSRTDTNSASADADVLSKPPKLEGTPTNEDPKEGINGRRLVFHSATYQYNLPSLVGHALYIQKEGNQCPKVDQPSYSSAQISADNYVKPGVELKLIDKLGPPLYESKVDKGVKLDVSVLIFSGGAHQQDIAEVALTDVGALPLPANSLQDGYEENVLSSLRPDECDAAMITGATVSTLSYKWYNKWDGKGKISGAAFGANGEIWQENSTSNLQFLIAIDIAPVRPKPIPGTHAALAPARIPQFLQLPNGSFPVRRPTHQ